MLSDIGLTEEDIKLTKADPGALGPMLMTGNSDVIIAWMTDVTRYTNQAKAAGKEIIVLPWEAAGLDMYSATLVASEKFLKDRPDVAKRFIGAFKKSLEYTNANRKDSVEAVRSVVPELKAEDVEGSINDAMLLAVNEVSAKDGLGVFEKSRLAESWKRTAQSLKLDPASLDPESVVDRRFVPVK